MIITKTPLRISFAGGGSDLHSYYRKDYGAVVSSSIDSYVYVMINRKFDDYIRVGYSQTEYVTSIDEIGHNIVRECLRKVDGFNAGIDIVYMADVLPRKWGTGLGFSSSLTVGLLNALYALKGTEVSPEKLALDACEIEIDILGAPIGKQDQYAVAFGGLNFIKFNNDETVNVEPLELSKSEALSLNGNLLLFYTGLSSESTPVLREQKRNTEKQESTRSNLDTMVELAEHLRDDFKTKNISDLGAILHQGWNLKRSLASKITNNKIDFFYNCALKAGAQGGKILGSGGGGFLLVYAEKHCHNRIRDALKDLKELDFGLSGLGSTIIMVD